MPDFIERQECRKCKRETWHAPFCSLIDPITGTAVTRQQAVTVRYVRERQPVPVTDEMVERVLGAFTGLEAVMRERVRNTMRFALEDALDGAKDE